MRPGSPPEAAHGPAGRDSGGIHGGRGPGFGSGPGTPAARKGVSGRHDPGPRQARGKGIPENWVPASTYFLVNNKGKIYGAVNVRHRLTKYLMIEGGHIGFGIRPSVRNQGYGTKILELTFDKVRQMGIKKVLITCYKDNVYSSRVIIKNGGILDSEIEKDNEIIQRFWIEL